MDKTGKYWETLKELYALTGDQELHDERRALLRRNGHDVADLRALLDRHTRRVLETLTPRLEAADKNARAFADLFDRTIPCGHAVADLIGGEDGEGERLVTKCGACLAERQKKREDEFFAGWRNCVYGRPGKERSHIWHIAGPTNATPPVLTVLLPTLACEAHRRRP